MAVFNVRDLLIDRVGVPVTTRESSPGFQVQVSPGEEILLNNPARIGFTIVNGGGNVLWVRPLRAPTPGFGFRVEPNGGALIAGWEEDGEVVAWSWWGVAIGVGTDVWFQETLIDAKAPRSPKED